MTGGLPSAEQLPVSEMADTRTVPEIRFKGFSGEWEERMIGELAEEYYGGGTPRTSATDYWNGNIPWIQSSDIPEGQLSNIEPRKGITEQGIKSSATKLVPENSIAIVTRVGVGKLAYMPYEYATSQDFLSLSKLKVDSWFATYLIWKKIQSELNSVQGTSIKGITKEELLSKTIMIAHPEEEQSQIGTFFQNLDSLITLHQCKYDKLTTVKKAMLKKMFPKEGADLPEIRFKGFTEKWERRTLGEEIEISSAARVHKNEWTLTGVPFFRSSDVVAAYNGKSNSKAFISAELYRELTKSIGRVQRDDILVTGGGSIGIPYLVESDEPLYFKDADLLWFKRSENISGRFLYTYLTTTAFRSYTQSITHIGTISHYTIEQAKSTPVKLPSLDEQNEIANFFNNLDSLITLQQRELDKLKNIKKACLEKMFV